MKPIRLMLVLSLSAWLAGCGDVDFHLSAKAQDAADIVLDGPRGTLSWHWGPKAYSQPFTLAKKELSHAPNGWSGALDLRLSSGRKLELAGEHDTFICKQGCEDLHVPLVWVVVDK
ncbi:MAG: hypothetical protein ABWX83_10535 [Luteibacter sp.]